MSATRYVESDALGALRDELVRAAVLRSAPRPRRRRAVLIAAVAALLLGATVAAATLTNLSTGVAEVDELLDIEAPSPGSPRADIRPGVGRGSEPLLVPIGDGVYKTVLYLSRDGGLCIASAEAHRGGVRGSFGGCPSLESAGRRISGHGAYLAGFTTGLDSRTFNLIVAGQVQKVRPLAPGDWRVLMTPPWTPEAPGARPLRLVVLIDDRDYGNPDDGFQPGEGTAIPDHASAPPSVELIYRDGHTRRVEN